VFEGQEIDQPVELFVEDEKFWIQEVSPSRQEVRIQPLDINDIDYNREFERLAITYAEYNPVVDGVHGTIELSSQVVGATDSTIPQSGVDRTFSATLSDSDQGFTEDMVGGKLTIENAFVISYEEVREWIPNPNVGISTEAPPVDIPKPSPPDWEKVRKKRGKRGRRKARRLKDAERGIPSRKTSPRTIDMGDDGLEEPSPESTETASPSTTPSGGGGAPDKDIFMSARYEVIWETTDIPQFARELGDSDGGASGRGGGGGGMSVVSQITSYLADIKMSLSGAPPPPLGVVEGDAVSVLSGLGSSNPSSPISIVLGEVFLLGIPLSASFNLLAFLRPRFPLFFLTFSQSGGDGLGISTGGASVDIPTFGFGIHSLTSS
jgi:hypothetical protein